MAGAFPRRPLRPLTLACAALALLVAIASLSAGTSRASAAIGPQPRIVGGGKTTIAEWPWQVALMQRGKKFADVGGLRRQFCAGSLVAPAVVITAAHCVIDRGFRRNHTLSVVSGRTTLSSDEGVESRVAATWVPSDPDGDVLYGGYSGHAWDVAVLQLAQPPGTGTPIKIAGPEETGSWDAGSPVFTTGWGRLAEDGRSSDQLRVAQLAVAADSTCSAPKAYGSEFDPSLMLCASAPGRDTCQGDSGGPLVAPIGAGTYRLVGDTSFGRGCADPKFPGIYGRIAQDPMRTALEQGVRGLTGTDVVAGAPAPPFPQLAVAAARDKAQAYADRQCRGRSCRRAEVVSCTAAGTGFICAIADRYKSRHYGKSSAKKELMIVSEGGAARILMVTGMRYPKGWG